MQTISPSSLSSPPKPIDPTYKPQISIVSLSANAPLEKILEIIDRDGGVILEDFTTAEDLESIQREVNESNTGMEDYANTAISLIPKETVVIPGLVGKSKMAARICEMPILEGLRRHILTDTFQRNREHLTIPYVIDPLLSTSLSFNIGTGAPRQLLHRDDTIHGIDHSQTFDLKKCSQFACLIAGCDTTRENGATMFIPGSHRWDDIRRPKTDEICFAGKCASTSLLCLVSVFSNYLRLHLYWNIAESTRNEGRICFDIFRILLSRGRSQFRSKLHSGCLRAFLHSWDF